MNGFASSNFCYKKQFTHITASLPKVRYRKRKAFLDLFCIQAILFKICLEASHMFGNKNHHHSTLKFVLAHNKRTEPQSQENFLPLLLLLKLFFFQILLNIRTRYFLIPYIPLLFLNCRDLNIIVIYMEINHKNILAFIIFPFNIYLKSPNAFHTEKQ